MLFQIPFLGSLIGHCLDFLIRRETDFFVKLWIVTTYFVFVFFLYCFILIINNNVLYA